MPEPTGLPGPAAAPLGGAACRGRREIRAAMRRLLVALGHPRRRDSWLRRQLRRRMLKSGLQAE